MKEKIIKKGYFKGCTISDLHVIAEFHKIVRNYLKMKRIQENKSELQRISAEELESSRIKAYKYLLP